jgi:site-specific recombinase XerD
MDRVLPAHEALPRRGAGKKMAGSETQRHTHGPSRVRPKGPFIRRLLEQGIAQEDVQYLAGHADARTTRLYDRRQKKVTRNIVERISI